MLLQQVHRLLTQQHSTLTLKPTQHRVHKAVLSAAFGAIGAHFITLTRRNENAEMKSEKKVRDKQY